MCSVNGYQFLISDSIQLLKLPVDEGISICVMHYKVENSKFAFILVHSFRRVVIYSHGNAADLAYCALLMDSVAKDFNADFICYDYEGYGLSTGDAHGACLSRDLQVVYQYARQFFQGKEIYLYGESSIFVGLC